MPTGQVADFPIIFGVWYTVAEEWLAERFRVWSFRTDLLPGNRQNTQLISAFFAKSITALCRP
jgi:hypothetical protein